jgi:ribosomal protein L37AE/L43A
MLTPWLAPPAAATTSATTQETWGYELAKLFVTPTSVCIPCGWDYVDKWASLSGHGYCLNETCFRSETNKNAKQARLRQQRSSKGKQYGENQNHGKGKQYGENQNHGKGKNYGGGSTWHNLSEPWHGKGIDHDKGKGVKGSSSSHDEQQRPPPQHHQQQQQQMNCEFCGKSTDCRVKIQVDRSSIWVCYWCHPQLVVRHSSDEPKTPPWKKKKT